MNSGIQTATPLLDLFSGAILLALLTGYVISGKRQKGPEGAFLWMIGLGCVQNFSLGVGRIIENSFLICFGHSLMGPFLLVFVEYVRQNMNPYHPTGPGYLLLTFPPALTLMCGCLFDVWPGWTGMPWTGREEAVWPLVPTLLCLCVVLIVLAMIIRNYRLLPSAVRAPLIIVPSVVFPASYALAVFARVQAGRSLMTMILIILYVSLHVRRERRLALQDKILAENRIELLKSKIRPHFLYNVLSVIYYLCGSNPEKAQEAVGYFISFLRNHLDTVEDSGLVPFSREMEGVRSYLSLEMLRFGDRLRVVYDLQEEDFPLPLLSVQPLAENAVQHGISRLPRGGTVRILSGREEDAWVIRVEDNGKGYDPSAPPVPGHHRVGLDNVRQRLQILCGGTLRVERMGADGGTVAEIRIPRKRHRDEQMADS